MTAASPAPDTESWTVVLQPAEVMRSLRKINTWKATGPDGVPEQVLRDCAPELGEVFRYLQPLPVTVYWSHMPEDIHNSATSKAGFHSIPQ